MSVCLFSLQCFKINSESLQIFIPTRNLKTENFKKAEIKETKNYEMVD